MLTLPDMAAWLRELHTHDLFRLETLPAYEAASDGEDYRRFLRGEPGPTVDKTRWLDTLRHDIAAGRRWRRARIIHRPMTDYERYSCAWGYPDNVRAGEDVRILEVGDDTRLDEQVGDFFVVDGRHVMRSVYDDGRLLGAIPVSGGEAAALIAVRDLVWDRAVPFGPWWADRRETIEARVA